MTFFLNKNRDRFESLIDRSGGENACHEWQGGRDKDGYGKFKIIGQTVRSHRVAFFLAHGRWPEPCCCHHCDNPSCCNDKHLFEGTDADNISDRDAKGRQAKGETSGRRMHPERYVGIHRGEKNPGAKLTEQDVRDIVANRLLCRVSNAEIARQRGLSPATVDNIMNGKCWSSVTGIRATR